MKLLQCLLLLLGSLIVLGCTNDDEGGSKTLSLALAEDDSFRVLDYQVLDKPFVQAQQQGLYQAHLLNADEKVLQKISFDNINVSSTQNGNSADFYVTLPLLSKAVEIRIYQLDGSSGHYQLNTDNRLLRWSIPDNVKQKSP